MSTQPADCGHPNHGAPDHDCAPFLPEYDEAAALRLLAAVEAHARQPRAFVLARQEDVSGVSGTGVVAQGVEFEDGTVALRWLSAWPTSVVFHDKGIEAVRAVHGHDGRTKVVWADDS